MMRKFLLWNKQDDMPATSKEVHNLLVHNLKDNGKFVIVVSSTRGYESLEDSGFEIREVPEEK